ncbi:asparagine synthase (glutamine-hydrolyzing) [Pseudonocardia tropica]|uniref:asparagine synthase (glutamine-hydrolyzing) n=1 Tax=Pseudonocardia tropica TaxID=681289 RepID=A0ABV1K252_9PSEU
MCGLLAMHSLRGALFPDQLARGLARIAHRGPDAQHVQMLESGRVGLGHARLRVIDPLAGDQPLSSADGRLVAVVNGEFYDHDRIRDELAVRGHLLRTRSDSEILLHLYEEHGTGCLSQLRGEFAFILWDGRAGRLFAARDRFGAKPLLHATVGGVLYLASEAKALFEAGVPARWDSEAFFQHSHVFVDQDRTMFGGVRQVPPGHYLLAEGGTTRTVCYWDVDYPRTGDTAGGWDTHGAAEAVRTALETAVRLRLRADVPVGCYLSGGVDSSAVLGMAALHSPGPVEAFTIRLDGDPGGECAVAERTASSAGARFQPVPVDRRMLADHFADAVWHAESILPNENTVAKFLLSRAARAAGCRVVLTGEGADEVFGGYAFVQRDGIRHAGPAREAVWHRTAGELGVPRAGAPELPTARVAELLGFVPSIISSSAQSAVYQRGVMRDEFLAPFARRDAYGEFVGKLDVAGQLAGRETLHQSLYLLYKSMLPNYLLGQLGDRMELAHGVEGRLPFLDHPLVELVRTIPARVLIGGPVEKSLLRDAARPVLPEELRTRRKRVFWSPAGLQPGDPVHEMLHDVLRGRALDALPFYDRRSVLGLLDAVPALARNPGAAAGVSTQLVSIASACLLQEQFAL